MSQVLARITPATRSTRDSGATTYPTRSPGAMLFDVLVM